MATEAHLIIDHARTQGSRRTDMLDLEVRQLAAELATMTGVFVRYDAAGQGGVRFAFTYVVRRDGGTWRIVVAIAHDAQTAEEAAR